MEPIVVLLSGGQDSATCLAWAIDKFGRDRIWPLSFYYGQKHEVELDCARQVAERFFLKERLHFMSAVQLQALGGAALTDKNVEVNVNAQGTGNKYAESHGLPSTFVPGRNLLFFTLAAAYGATLGATSLVTGVCQADRAGYPDCRSEFVEAAQDAIGLALDEPWTIMAPLLDRTKASTWQLAEDLGILDVIIEKTHTCYKGDRSMLHAWGYGCGECGACHERMEGYHDYRGRALQSEAES
jgi:7-cyano-7-deazaguanine synthase